jgi:hypothetical protein
MTILLIFFNIQRDRSRIMSSNTGLKKISHQYNHHQILNLISIIYKKRVLLHIQKFLIWMI